MPTKGNDSDQKKKDRLDEKGRSRQPRKKAAETSPSVAATSEQERAEQEESMSKEEMPEQLGIGKTEPVDSLSEDEEIGVEEAIEGDEESKEAGFPVVGIGASAGGLEALEEFFSHMPNDSGMAFVVVSHTDPSRTSMLPGILQRVTRMPVQEAREGMTIERNAIYLPPSNRDLVLEKNVFHLQEMHRGVSFRLPIDTFFKSLAKAKKDRAACIILSGTGTDGTQGLRIIKEKGGMAMVQSEQSAKYEGMPSSAISTGLADFILPPAKMPEQLREYFCHEVQLKAPGEAAGTEDFAATLSKIITVLGNRIGHDFSQYKKSTLVRRIQRRMSVTRTPTAERYLSYLHRHPEEIHALFQDLLIGVTSFFRDPEAFEALKRDVLPELLSQSGPDQPFRVWIPGCATGEEVYSVIMLIVECLDELQMRKPFQVFGTDIDPSSIEKAREGIYPQNIAADVSPERLARFFVREENRYRIRKELREPIVFAVQNVLKDPPFSKLDLLVCRNLLIYLEAKAQKRLLPLFHYTLRSGGILFLGSSETVGSFSDLFSVVNKKWNIYRRRDVSAVLRPFVDFPTGTAPEKDTDMPLMGREGIDIPEPGIATATERIILERHTPPCVVVNRKGDICFIHRRTGKYLEPAPGHASLNLVDMAREGLRFELASAIRKAAKTNERVRREGLRVKTNGGLQEFNLTVEPLGRPAALKDMLLVVFEDVGVVGKPKKTGREEGSADDGAQRIIELERELAKVQQDHRTAMEELESSREELQSLNEELSTVNAELHDKIQELAESYDTITEVLNSTRVAILFLNNDLEVRRFTEEAARLINLIHSDIGRPITHIATNLEYEGLVEDIQRVNATLSVVEKEVRTRDGHWYFLRIIPYRTKKGRAGGTVLTFINVDDQKAVQKRLEEMNEQALQTAERFAESIIDTVRESLVVLDTELKVITANRSFYRTFQTTPENALGKHFCDIGDGQWNIHELRKLLEKVTKDGETFENFEVEYPFPETGQRRLLLNARKLYQKDAGDEKILLAIERTSV